MEVVFFEDMVAFAIAGARSAPLRRCVSFRDDEGTVHYGDVREVGRRGRRPLRDGIDFRDDEGVVSREKIRIFGSQRMSSTTEMR